MQLKLSPAFRVVLYVLTVIGTPVVVYLRAKDLIGDLELALWGAEVSAVTTVAALKVPAANADAAAIYAEALARRDAAVAGAGESVDKIIGRAVASKGSKAPKR